MTEKDYNPENRNKKNVVNTPKKSEEGNTPIKETIKEEPEKEIKEDKKQIIKKPIVKKDFAVVNAKSVPISTKDAVAICKFIKRKKIAEAVLYLEQTVRAKKAIPMKGEIPHRKGKGMMSGRYPKNASLYFIKILKSLGANANYNGLNAEEVIITEAIPNNASRPFGQRGRVRRKRTHITIKCRESKTKGLANPINKKKKDKGEKKK